MNENELGKSDETKPNTVCGYSPIPIILSSPDQLLSTISVDTYTHQVLEELGKENIYIYPIESPTNLETDVISETLSLNVTELEKQPIFIWYGPK